MTDANGYCMKNIEILAMRRKITKKELEKKAGLSEGYLSRCKKESKIPKLKALLNIADELDATVDLLVRYRISELSPDDLKVYRFLNALSVKTTRMEIQWRCDNSAMEGKKLSVSVAPMDDAFASYQCHCADLGNGITVCLVTLFQESPDTLKSAPSFVLTALEEGREMRMFLIQGDKAHFVCSKRLNGNLSDALYKLYRLAKQNEMSDSLFLDDETRSVLDSLIGPNARAASDLF